MTFEEWFNSRNDDLNQTPKDYVSEMIEHYLYSDDYGCRIIKEDWEFVWYEAVRATHEQLERDAKKLTGLLKLFEF